MIYDPTNPRVRYEVAGPDPAPPSPPPSERPRVPRVRTPSKLRRTTNAAARIPEEVQAPMRNRLKLLRTQLRIPRSKLNTLTSGSMLQREEQDLSPLKLGDLWGLANEFGYTLDDLIRFVIGTDVSPAFTEESRSIKRMIVYMRSLSSTNQVLACDLIRALVENQDLRQALPSIKERISNESVISDKREQLD